MKKIIALTSLCSLMFGAGLIQAEELPKSMSADSRVKIVAYDPNNVVLLKERYGYQTQISFSSNEVVQSVSIGDSSAWQVAPLSNHLFIKPVATSKTNMTVITNVNSYSFQLDSTDTQANLTYKLQFTYPEDSIKSNPIEIFNPDQLNWKYSFTGERSLAPLEAFDNGKFTYLKFKQDGASRLPAVYAVDKKRNEALINYHMQGNYMVIHTVANQFTLREGEFVTSVYNDDAIGDWGKIS